MLKQLFITVASLCLLLATCLTAFAQSTMLMGRVIDPDSRPYGGAAIYLKALQDEPVAVSADNGLFNSALLPIGKYKVRVVMNNKTYKAGYINLTGEKAYFTFTILGKNIKTSVGSDKNPFMESRLGMIKASDKRMDAPVGRHDTQTPMEPYPWRIHNTILETEVTIDTSFKLQKTGTQK